MYQLVFAAICDTENSKLIQPDCKHCDKKHDQNIQVSILVYETCLETKTYTGA